MIINETLIKMAEQYEKTAEIFLNKAKLLRSGIDSNKCKYSNHTNKLVNTNECRTCGNPTWIECNNIKVVADRVNSNKCNRQNCKFFSSIQLVNLTKM